MSVTGQYMEVPREAFTWVTNPLVDTLRPYVSEMIHSEGLTVFNELDVVLQSLLSVCAFSPEEVWGMNSDYAIEGAAFISSRRKGVMQHEPHISYDNSLLNTSLIRTIVTAHASRSVTYKEQLPGDLCEDIFDIPPVFDQLARLTTAHRSFVRHDGTLQMHVREASTGHLVTMREIDGQTSSLYAKNLHYIHRARNDEVAAYGAFLEKARFPFAWVSYGPIGSDEEKNIAELSGLAPESAIEMTRAWNASWSPKNTMSMLFSFAHTQLQLRSRNEQLGSLSEPLAGVTTAINPNLGFTGMAFKGVDFASIGFKRANHKFLVREDGIPLYMLTPDIALQLGVDRSALEGHKHYRESAMPLLPINVLGVIFNGKKRLAPTGPLYFPRAT